jgi:hypothetical protein
VWKALLRQTHRLALSQHSQAFDAGAFRNRNWLKGYDHFVVVNILRYCSPHSLPGADSFDLVSAIWTSCMVVRHPLPSYA